MKLSDLFGGNTDAADDAGAEKKTDKKIVAVDDKDGGQPSGLDAIISMVGKVTSSGDSSKGEGGGSDPMAMIGSLISSFSGKDKDSDKPAALADLILPLLTQQGLLGDFKKSPVKALEKIIGVDLPDELIDPVIAIIQEKLGMNKAKE